MLFGGYIELNEDVFDAPTIQGINGWKIDEASINNNNLKFILDRTRVEGEGTLAEGEVLKITLKSKATASTQDVKIRIVGLEGTNAYIKDSQTMEGLIIKTADVETNIKISSGASEITSNIYNIKNGYISNITAGTTQAQFIANVNPKTGLTFANLTDTGTIKTGTTVTLNSNTYTLIVKGDLNCDGVVDVTDISQIKLHYLEAKFLTGIRLKAADMNVDGEGGTLTDVSLLQQLYLRLDNKE